MKLTLSTLSEAASVDQQTNQLSIFNIIENLQVFGTLPAQYPKFTLVGVWERDNDETTAEANANCKITMLSPSGVSKTIGELEVKIPAGQRRVRTIANLIGVTIEAEGLNKIVFEIKDGSRWKQVHSIGLDVTAISPSPQA